MVSPFCKTQYFDKQLALLRKFFIWEFMKTLKKIRNVFCGENFRYSDVICTYWVLMHLGIQYTIASVYYFSITLKVKRLVYFLFSSINSSHLLSHLFPEYHFNLIPSTYNGNIVECFVNRNHNKLFGSASRHLMTSIYFRIGLDLGGLILVFSFLNSLSTSKIPQVSIYQLTISFNELV